VRVCERKSKREAGRNREGVRDKETSRERKSEFEIVSPEPFNISACTRTHARTHARTRARMHARMHACTHACMHARMHAHTHVPMHVLTYARTYTSMHALFLCLEGKRRYIHEQEENIHQQIHTREDLSKIQIKCATRNELPKMDAASGQSNNCEYAHVVCKSSENPLVSTSVRLTIACIPPGTCVCECVSFFCKSLVSNW